MRALVGDVPLGGSPFPPIADYAFLSDCETCALVAPSSHTNRRAPTDTDADHVLLRTLRCVNGRVTARSGS